MKRIFIIFAASLTALLTGCNDQTACIKAVAEANQITAEAAARQATAMLAALQGTDVLAKGMAMGWFMNQDKRLQLMGVSDCGGPSEALQWASVLVPGATNIYGIAQGNKTARHSSDNSVALQQINMGTLGNVANTAITQPPVVIGPTEGFGTLYPTN